MADLGKYEFDIDAFTPMTLPMGRLSEYLKPLAILLGSEDHVHFLRVDEGSAKLIKYADPAFVSKIDRRLMLIRDKTGPSTALKAYGVIDTLLAEDNGSAVLSSSSGIVIEFPGAKRNREEIIGPVLEQGSITGVLFQIGGRDETVSVHLKSGDDVLICTVNREQARALGAHLFNHVRMTGLGKWTRDDRGRWELQQFVVSSYVGLRHEPISDVVSRLRSLAPPNLDATKYLSDLNEDSGR